MYHLLFSLLQLIFSSFLLLILFTCSSSCLAEKSLTFNSLQTNSSTNRHLLQANCYKTSLNGNTYTFADLFNGPDLDYQDPNSGVRYYMHWCKSLEAPGCTDTEAACGIPPIGSAFQINQGGGIPCDSWALLNPDTPTDGLVCKLADQLDSQNKCLGELRVAVYQFFCSTKVNPQTALPLISVRQENTKKFNLCSYTVRLAYFHPSIRYYFLIASCDACISDQFCGDNDAPVPLVFPLPAVSSGGSSGGYIPPGPGPGSKKQGLSGGSIFLIIFFVGLFVYFAGGATLLKYQYHATGFDILPNLSFWKDLPFLIKDGCVYFWGLTVIFIYWVVGRMNGNSTTSSSSYEKM